MQTWEQQVASLSRQLTKVTSESEDAQRERQTLLDSLRASEQVRRPYQDSSESKSWMGTPLVGHALQLMLTEKSCTLHHCVVRGYCNTDRCSLGDVTLRLHSGSATVDAVWSATVYNQSDL